MAENLEKIMRKFSLSADELVGADLEGSDAVKAYLLFNFNLIEDLTRVLSSRPWIIDDQSLESRLKISRVFHSIKDVSIPQEGGKEGRHLKLLVEIDIAKPLLRGTLDRLEGITKWVDTSLKGNEYDSSQTNKIIRDCEQDDSNNTKVADKVLDDKVQIVLPNCSLSTYEVDTKHVEKIFVSKEVPPWQSQLTLRALVVSFVLGVLFTFIVMKLILTSAIIPSLNVSAGLMGFFFVKIWT
ncbi:hypothetical protein ACH5RR_013488 [Cinchona calisaya]|uniref:Uncharacterized protein n=1 Tax=Cinchona calisaya TaxID=153742 RepID=A0ABD3A2E7_9GENT